jgi:hypothetical protein
MAAPNLDYFRWVNRLGYPSGGRDRMSIRSVLSARLIELRLTGKFWHGHVALLSSRFESLACQVHLICHLRQCSGYRHLRISGNCHHTSCSFPKASGSPTCLHSCPNILSGRFRSHLRIPSSSQVLRTFHPLIRLLRPTQACRRLHFHSTRARSWEQASNSRQCQSSRVGNCELQSPHPLPGRSGLSFLLVVGSSAHRSGTALESCRVSPLL